MLTTSTIKNWVASITIVIIFLSLLFGGTSGSLGIWIGLSLMVLLGIPHGATDHILFRHINKDFGKGFFYRFLARYLILMGLYLLAWWILPSLALLLFLAISAYHFGQSHWNNLEINSWYKYTLYLLWGSTLLITLLLINHGETMPIVNSMIGFEIKLSSTVHTITISTFCFFTFSFFFYLYSIKILSLHTLIKEVLIYLLLIGLFFSQSLLIGFSIYFVLWHSTLSIADQIEYFKKYRPDYTISDFIKESTPFSLIAFGCIGSLAYYSPYSVVSIEWIGQLFILISVVTLPHSILMDAILESNENENKQEKNKTSNYSSRLGVSNSFQLQTNKTLKNTLTKFKTN